jgi:glycosyltransferase 2 family protein
MRKFLVALVLFIGVLFIMARFSEVQAIVETLQRGDWRFLILALGMVGLWLLAIASSYCAVYSALDLNETLKRMLPMASASLFLNIVAPSAGMSGMAIFIAEARRMKYSTGRAAVAGAVVLLLDYTAFLSVLALGLVVLFRRNTLDAGEIIPSAIMLTISMVVATLIYLGMRSEKSLGKALAWMARGVNRILEPFLKRKYLSEQRAYEFAAGAAEGIHILLETPKTMILPVGLALVKQALLITILWCSLRAFQVSFSPGTLIAGFSIGYLFLIVSPTPAGLGFVEGALSLALSSMYIPFSEAAIVTLAYRGFTFWIPLFAGMISFRALERLKDDQPYGESSHLKSS